MVSLFFNVLIGILRFRRRDHVNQVIFIEHVPCGKSYISPSTGFCVSYSYVFVFPIAITEDEMVEWHHQLNGYEFG